MIKRRFKVNFPESISVKNIDISLFNEHPVILQNHDWHDTPLGVAQNVKLSHKGMFFTPKFHKLTDASKYHDFFQRNGMIVDANAGGVVDEKGNFKLYEVSICR